MSGLALLGVTYDCRRLLISDRRALSHQGTHVRRVAGSADGINVTPSERSRPVQLPPPAAVAELVDAQG